MSQQHLEIQQLKKRIENTKLFTFMIIHDLKHPTESLIESLKQVKQQLLCKSVELVDFHKDKKKFLKIILGRKDKQDN